MYVYNIRDERYIYNVSITIVAFWIRRRALPRVNPVYRARWPGRVYTPGACNTYRTGHAGLEPTTPEVSSNESECVKINIETASRFVNLSKKQISRTLSSRPRAYFDLITLHAEINGVECLGYRASVSTTK